MCKKRDKTILKKISSEMCRNYFVFKNNQKMFNISRQIRYKGTFYDAKKPPVLLATRFSFGNVVRYRLQYQPKVSVNFGFGFGKPKYLVVLVLH